MLTDAEMQRLLDARAEAGDALSYMLGDCAPHVEAYIKALDAALPKLVEEVRRLRAKVKEWNEYTGVLGDSDEEEESNG